MTDLWHLEDFTVGRVFHCGPYAVTKDEIIEFAREFDAQPHHPDEEAAKTSMLKGLSASGFHVCAMTMRMLADDILNKSANRGGAGAREVRWMKPVRPGDVLRVEAEVAAVKASQSKPIGFITMDCRLFNQTEQVAFLSMTPIIGKRA